MDGFISSLYVTERRFIGHYLLIGHKQVVSQEKPRPILSKTSLWSESRQVFTGLISILGLLRCCTLFIGEEDALYQLSVPLQTFEMRLVTEKQRQQISRKR